MGIITSEELYWQWLCSCPILTRTEILALTRYFHSARGVYDASTQEISGFRKVGLKWADSLIAYKNSCDIAKCGKLLDDRQIHFCSKENPLFPEKLTYLPDCPFGLFYKGKLPDPSVLSVAIIGARRCSNYGSRMAAYLGEQLAKRHVQVISGMAAGIDGLAQRACVERGGSSFAVLGCGADICYPPENGKLYKKLPENGGVLSEYGPSTPPLPYNFPIRNRLISGLADALIVVEARKKSGSLITVDMALDQGKDVYAVPGRFGDELSYGCNHLIEQGASLLSSVDGLIDEMSGRLQSKVPRKAKFTAEQVVRERRKGEEKDRQREAGEKEKISREELTEMEQRIYRRLDLYPKGFDTLMEETGLSMMQLMQGLLSLQMKSYAAEISKGRYAKMEV